MQLILAFAELGLGVLLLASGITNASLADVIRGKASFTSDSTPLGGGGASTPTSLNAAGQTNPIPGATGNRLDQGFDVTASQFLAPFVGKIVYSTPSDPGWAGGGYVAIANLLNPSQVVYFAEGLIPTVTQGQTVAAGEQLANPAPNPYNGIVGNIETGPANPANPRQPLAQVASDPAAVVQQFYQWIRSLGGPAATSTSLAGHA